MKAPEDVEASARAFLTKLRAIYPTAQMKRHQTAFVYYSKPNGATLESIGTPENLAVKIIVTHSPVEKK